MDHSLDLTDITPRDATTPVIGRPLLRVECACCAVYQRIYRSTDDRSYQGRCPGCGKHVKFQVDADGTTAWAFYLDPIDSHNDVYLQWR